MICLWYMNKPHRHIIQLSRKELVSILSIIRRGRHNSRVITRARILLLSHNGEGKDAIASRLEIVRAQSSAYAISIAKAALTERSMMLPAQGSHPKLPSPPKFIVLDGYTEETYVRHNNKLKVVIDENYE